MWLVGVVSQRWVESMGMVTMYIIIGVVSGWCCKEVLYPHNNKYFYLLRLY